MWPIKRAEFQLTEGNEVNKVIEKIAGRITTELKEDTAVHRLQRRTATRTNKPSFPFCFLLYDSSSELGAGRSGFGVRRFYPLCFVP
jgi:hypothetical protein